MISRECAMSQKFFNHEEPVLMPGIDEVKDSLRKWGIEVREFAEPTPNSQAAARAVGCSVGEIAKSILVLIGGQAVLVVTSGDVKLKNPKLKQATGLTGKVRLPDAEDVIFHTGYAPGGVCPFLLPRELPVLVDSSMRRFPKVYAAAGNDHSAVPITVDQLLGVTGGTEVDVCVLPSE
jgi:prolyl-tRNA editing enzyme YbaK/EbsC (Cys-tRNA(Pro) deacylase)